MHLVTRGNEPHRLSEVRIRYTPGWVNYYILGRGSKPSDAKWREFSEELGGVFNYICGYCEKLCIGEVDHFRPKTLFPQYVYVWNNWIYACNDCNKFKGVKWPSKGFIDPCSIDSFCEESQCCVIFELSTGEVLPHPGLSKDNISKVKNTIHFLRLNITFHLKRRLRHIKMLNLILDLAQYDSEKAAEYLAELSLPQTQLSSLTDYYLKFKGYKV